MGFASALTRIQRALAVVGSDGVSYAFIRALSGIATAAPTRRNELAIDEDTGLLWTANAAAGAGAWIGAVPVAMGTATIEGLNTTTDVLQIQSTAGRIVLHCIVTKSGGSSTNYTNGYSVGGPGGINLTITVDTAPGAGESATVAYAVFPLPS